MAIAPPKAQNYNSARSCPTRAALMTGLQPHHNSLRSKPNGNLMDHPRKLSLAIVAAAFCCFSALDAQEPVRETPVAVDGRWPADKKLGNN